MENQHVDKVSTTQVGSAFVRQYYQVLQQQRDYLHHFYTRLSSMIRVDGDVIHSTSDVLDIYALLNSINFTAVQIKKINSLESWNKGILVVISGSVKSRDFVGWRKFVQTFLLAPRENGYFVMNDVFHFVDEEHHQPSASVAQEQTEDKTSYEEDTMPESVAVAMREPQSAAKESFGEPENPPTYASILLASVKSYESSMNPQPAFERSNLPAAEKTQQQSASSDNVVAEDSFSLDEGLNPFTCFNGECKSIYVKNLPNTVTNQEVHKVFKNFGRIKSNGVFVKVFESGVCYAFVDFKDVQSARNAIQASPILFGRRKVYVEGRKSNAGPTSSSGRRGRGKGDRGGGRSDGKKKLTKAALFDVSSDDCFYESNK